ncbi:Trm112 family protein [candidate division TA06 bacterium]|uniref:UPF0434 protein HY768_02355 n=1 Tax=candidate division TA06 bacterium TaxID=2250710 RepID=A0A933I896_UNCT6|nr:Trm112 family protein [candidate division TA06 bacterium]
MLDPKLLEILACPKCKGELEYRPKEQKLLCWSCKLGYNIKDDIPIMLIDEAEPLTGGKK